VKKELWEQLKNRKESGAREMPIRNVLFRMWEKGDLSTSAAKGKAIGEASTVPNKSGEEN
jgi:hypothetical protein